MMADDYCEISEDDIKAARQIEEALENESLTSASGKIQEYLKKISDVQLNIAITGESGSGLRDHGQGFPQVFLISSFELHLYDFPNLVETMEKELPDYKRRVLLLSIPNMSLKINQRKKENLQANIWRSAFESACVAVIPIPGLSVSVDIAILIREIRMYYQAFGLDNESLKSLADRTNVPVEELKAILKSPLNKEISQDMVIKMLTKTTGATLMLVEYFLSTIPVFGSTVACGISFGTTYYMLNNCLNELAEDAQNVLMKALKVDE